MTRRFFLIVCLALTTGGLIGCGGSGGYQLRGRVVTGPVPTVSVIEKAEASVLRGGEGVPNATIDIMLDPKSLGRKIIAQGQTDYDGNFEIPIEEFGAGFLEHEIAILTRAVGFQGTEKILMLPSSDKQLLIILKTGRDRTQPRYTPEDDLRRYGY